MPELKNLFNRGRMNKDLDERLVPNGEYRDALNVTVDTSEDSDVGAVQNVLGNTLLDNRISTATGFTTWTSSVGDKFGLSNPTCVGIVKDDRNETIYWFIKDDNGSYIAEYNQTTDLITPVIIDRNNVLNFSANSLITGINIIGDLLFFTDNNSEPKRINIKRFKEDNNYNAVLANINWTTHSKVRSYNTSLANSKEFTLADVTVIKPSPRTAPTMTLARSKRSGIVSTSAITSSFVDSTGDQLPVGTIIGDEDTSTLIISDGITFNSATDFELGDILVFSSIDDDNIDEPVVARVKIEAISANGDTVSVKILSIDEDLSSSITNFTVELQEETSFFEFKFPRFATRYKYIDGEFSCISPFTTIAFLPEKFNPTEFKYNPKEGYNLAMVNDVRKITLSNLVPKDSSDATGKSTIPKEIKEVEILYKESDSNNVYTVATVKYAEKAWTSNEFIVEGEQIYATIPSNQILRPFDNVPKKAKSQEITGNRLLFGNYTHQYNLIDKNGTEINVDLVAGVEKYNPYASDLGVLTFPAQAVNGYIVSGTGTSFLEDVKVGDNLYQAGTNLFLGTVSVVIDDNNILLAATPPITGSISTSIFPFSDENLDGFPSIKSLRTYQLGVVYSDEFGRQTPVLAPRKETKKTNSIKVEKEFAADYSRLTCTVKNDPPEWATHYQYYVKETSSEYYNLAMDRFYEAEDGNIWISFPSSERNKVDVGDFLELKKAHDSNTPIEQEAKFKILAIENEAPDYIKEVKFNLGQVSTQFTENGFPLENKLFIEIPEADWNVSTLIDQEKNNNLFCRISHSGNKTSFLDISSIAQQGGNFRVALADVLGSEIAFTSTENTYASRVSGDLTFELFEGRDKKSAEFAGRFFAKLRRNDILDSNVLGQEEVENFGILYSQKLYMIRNQPATSKFWKDTIKHQDQGNGGIDAGWFIDQTPSYDLIFDNGFLADEDKRLRVGRGIVTAEDGNIDASVTSATVNKTYGHNDCNFIEHGSGIVYDASGNFYGYSDDKTTSGNSAANSSGIALDLVITTDNFKKIVLGMELTRVVDPNGNTVPSHLVTQYGNLPIAGMIVLNKKNETTTGGTITVLLPHANPLFPNLASADSYPGKFPNGTGITISFADDTSTGQSTYHKGDKISISFSGFGGFISENKQWSTTSKRRAIWDEFGRSIKPQFAGFVEALETSGTKIRFTDDPDGTVYTVVQTVRKNLLNYNRDGGGDAIDKEDGEDGASRRVRFDIQLDKPLVHSLIPSVDLNNDGNGFDLAGLASMGASANKYTSIEIVKDLQEDLKTFTTANPAIFETEPKKSIDLDIYHAMDEMYPILKPGLVISGTGIASGTTIKSLDKDLKPFGIYISAATTGSLTTDSVLTFTNVAQSFSFTLNAGASHSSGVTFIQLDKNYETNGNKNFYLGNNVLDWFNCYSFNNGVESDRIRDDFNAVRIDKGPIVSTTLAEQYKEGERKTGLIFSGIFNSTSGINRLNQFIQAEDITKDLNPVYGSIQKLHTRDTDVISLCEDKIIRVLANKDALFNADGNANVTSNANVLGQAVPYIGEYGISTNPESFASYGFRAYFSDKNRGVVLRLSRDGLTPISRKGMSDFFSDGLAASSTVLGSYDDDKGSYNITLTLTSGQKTDLNTTESKATLSFKESVDGWTSRFSYIPEAAVSLNNIYYSIKDAQIYSHNNETRNTFYGTAYKSLVKPIINASASNVKNFKTLSYEGDADWIASSIETDQQSGQVLTFEEKEGKYYNYIKGIATTLTNLDTKEFSVQGIDNLTSSSSSDHTPTASITVTNSTS